METTQVCRVVSFGLGGHSEDYCSRKCGSLQYGPSSLSGYDRPHNWAPRANTDYSRAVVIDKREAVETPAGYSWVFKGPMVSADLEPGELDALPEVSPIMAGAMAENPYGGLLAVAESQRGKVRAGALDHVSPEEYAAGWRDHGARIGRVESGAIVWE
jgi:hypothetical protein